MRQGKLSRVSVGIYMGMILCCTKLIAQTNTFPSSGNVGIGTSSPGSNLEVHGDGTIASGLAITGSGEPYAYNHLYSGTTPEQSLNLFFGDTVNTYYGFNIQGGTPASPTNFVTVLASGNVGIGTTTPGTTLEVNGNVQVDGTINAAQGINVVGSGDPSTYNTLNFSSAWGPISWGSTSNGVNGWGTTLWSWAPANTTNGANLAFATGNGTTISPNSNIRMLIDQNGNVGIGTNRPGATLEVNGNVKLTSGSGASLTFPDGTVQSTAYVGTTCSIGGGQLGPATAPSGSCSTNGAWAFSQDGHATFCASGTWTTKI